MHNGIEQLDCMLVFPFMTTFNIHNRFRKPTAPALNNELWSYSQEQSIAVQSPLRSTSEADPMRDSFGVSRCRRNACVWQRRIGTRDLAKTFERELITVRIRSLKKQQLTQLPEHLKTRRRKIEARQIENLIKMF